MLKADQSIPLIKSSGSLRVSDIPADALAQMTAGLAEASRHTNDPPRNKLPIGDFVAVKASSSTRSVMLFQRQTRNQQLR